MVATPAIFQERVGAFKIACGYGLKISRRRGAFYSVVKELDADEGATREEDAASRVCNYSLGRPFATRVERA